MGGGTGTGAAPVIAAAARSMGCVTVAVVTEPFEFEGRQRSRQAAAGLAELRKAADTVLVVANDKLLEIVPGRMTMADAFLVADDVLRQGVRHLWSFILSRGCVGLFSPGSLRSLMHHMYHRASALAFFEVVDVLSLAFVFGCGAP